MARQISKASAAIGEVIYGLIQLAFCVGFVWALVAMVKFFWSIS